MDSLQELVLTGYGLGLVAGILAWVVRRGVDKS